MNQLLIRGLKKLKLLKYLNINGIVNLNNKRFPIPVLQEVGLSNLFISEPWMIELLKIVLPIEDKVFVDVGVNIGQTLLKLKSVSPEIQYLGFEPNPMCINYVDKLISENKFKNTSLIPVGISNKTEIGVLNFFHESGTDTSASMIAEFRPDHKVEKKEYIPLFEIEELEKSVMPDSLSVLKIDVEGAEYEVLSSFEPLIKAKKPIILIEILPVYNDENVYRIERQDKILEILFNAGYSIYRVQKENDILIDLIELSEIEIHSDLNKCDYVMVPDNKKDKFESYCQQKLKQ
ncbi:MAG: FkbM family methyltransferase [Bacteroidia bacterium]